MLIRSDRLTLRSWREADRDQFAQLHGSPDATPDLVRPLSRKESDAKFDRYRAAFEQHGFSRWAIEDSDGRFLGYAGIMPSRSGHPLGEHFEAGWRLRRAAWGHGYATEAACASIRDSFTRFGIRQVLVYTSADNRRSQAVIARLNLARAAALDFTISSDRREWRGLVWIACHPA